MPFLPCALILSLAPPPPLFTPQSVSSEHIPWTQTTGGGPFGRALCADLTGNGSPDVVRLRDQRLSVCLEADAFDTSVLVMHEGDGLVVHDACLVENGGRRVASVGPDGLVITKLTPTTMDTELAAGGDWIGAGVIREYEGDLFALTPNRLNILRIENLGGTNWGSSSALALSMAAADFRLIQWDADAAPEFLIADAVGVRVLDDDGQEVYLRGTPLAPGMIEVIDNGPEDNESIAWVINGPSSAYLTIIESDGTVWGHTIPQRTAANFTAGRVTGDTRSDLAITFTDDDEALFLQYLGQAPFFDVNATDQQAFWIDYPTPSAPVPLSDPLPSFGDLDGDGDADLFVSTESGDGTCVMHGPLGSDGLEHLITGENQLVEGTVEFCEDTDGKGVLRVQLRYPMPVGTTHLRHATFLQDDTAAFTDEESISFCPLAVSQGENDIELEFVIPPPASGDWGLDPRILHVIVQPANGETESAVATGPKVVGHLALNSTQLNGLDVHESWNQVTVIDSIILCDTLPIGGQPIGGFAMGKRLPPLPPGHSPMFGSACITSPSTGWN